MFLERLKNVKKATDEAYQKTIASGRKLAEKDFPEIVNMVEKSALKSSCGWKINNPFSSETMPPLLYSHYCHGYMTRLVELIDDSGFSVRLDGPSDSQGVTIDWYVLPGKM